jgi:hypothetical protein
MNLHKEKFYKEFVRRENDIYRAPYNPELEFYSQIKAGNISKVRELCKDALEKGGYEYPPQLSARCGA